MEGKLTSQVGQNRLLLHEAIPLATPLVVYVEPSGYCNLSCAFCPQGSTAVGLKKAMMPVDLFKKMVDDIALFPDRIKLLRICGNGDPLTNPNLPGMLEYAFSRNIAEKIELITNALLLTPELINCLPRYLTRLVCSIEGLSPDDYQRICNARVDFERFLRTLDSLYAGRGTCTIHVKIHHAVVASPEQEARFFELFRTKCDEIFVEKLVPMWPQLNTSFSSNEFRWGNGPVIRRRVCAQIFKGVQVQADGEVVPCCVDWNRVNVIGDLRHEPLTDIWHGEKLRKLRVAHLSGHKDTIEPCKDCSMNDYCEIDDLDDHANECLERLMSEELP